MGGIVLAGINNLGGLCPVVTWGSLVLLLIYRLLAPGYDASEIEDVVTENTVSKETKTRKAAAMAKTVMKELAKSAVITILFHTVGVDALSL